MSKIYISSNPPAYHANVYDDDLEKGLPLYTQQDTNKSPNSGSLKAKEKKDIAMDQLGDFYSFLDERKREASQFLNREFPGNVVLKEKLQRLLSTIIPSLAFIHIFSGLIGLLYVVILMGCVLPFVFSAIGKIIGMVVGTLMYCVGTIMCGVGYVLYSTLLACLGLDFVSSTDHTRAPTLPSYQQRDNTLAPPPTDIYPTT
ncbi:hypothetical protein SOMG_01160 [Schizosaccharomyces osmophilus]|uniref:Uncharacterized protein n=1 Tax=Schizosaccharomyces osmophilus TaxID=2545709 RepID=A0AAF0AU35_9SCHI|nr:uncharacterized protein SOMG_01160 [Schizosaccharomyces osmophilus]WBW72076.1 hypothetical protein SOMG_01160 [Schizosaccharomyces osmophilus]